MTAQTYTDLTDAVGLAVKRAQAHLVGRQDAAGWWKGELRTNVTMDAEDLLLRQFLGILKPGETAEAARWIRSQQRADGTWATFDRGPGWGGATGRRSKRKTCRKCGRAAGRRQGTARTAQTPAAFL